MASNGEPDDSLTQQECDHHTSGVRVSHRSGVKTIQRTEKETQERNYRKPLNGFFAQLPDLDQPQAKTEHIAQTILDALGDKHSDAIL